MSMNRRQFLSTSAATAIVASTSVGRFEARAAATAVAEIGNETQLLIDDFLIDRTEGLSRILHQPQKQGLIKEADGRDFERGAVYLGKIVCQDRAGQFHMTYRYYWWDEALQKLPRVGIDKAHWFHETTGYATSPDGVHWTKPDLGRFDAPGRLARSESFPFEVPQDVSKHNNFGYPIVLARDLHAHGNITDPSKRFLLRVVENYSGTDPFAKPVDPRMYFASDWPDVRDPQWKEKLTAIPNATIAPRGEGFPTISGYDHEAGEWFMTCQDSIGNWLKRGGRDIARFSSPDLITWSGPQNVLPVAADESKQPHDWVEYMDLWPHRVGGTRTGAWLGQLWIFRSDRSNLQYETPHMKDVWRKGTTEVRLVISRDAGKSWQRVGDRSVWLPHHPEDDGYDRLPCLGCPVRVGDELRFYYACWNGDHLSFFRDGRPYYDNRIRNSSTAWAKLRWDGFASLDAGSERGELRTKFLRFDGSELRVNVDTKGGQLRVELQDENGSPIPGFSLNDSIPLSADGVSTTVRWQNEPSLKALSNLPIRIRFELRNGSLYSFQFC